LAGDQIPAGAQQCEFDDEMFDRSGFNVATFRSRSPRD
jgi:hypothetical protein